MEQRGVGWVRLGLFGCVTWALIATTAPDGDATRGTFLERDLTAKGDDVLTSAAPSRTRRFRVHAVRPLEDQVALQFEGQITQPLSAAAPAEGELQNFVDVTVNTGLANGKSMQAAATQFQLVATGELPSECAQSGTNCNFEVEVEFARRDAGARAIDVQISWVLTMRGFAAAAADGGPGPAWLLEELSVAPNTEAVTRDGGVP
jgi:hypothetical protein